MPTTSTSPTSALRRASFRDGALAAVLNRFRVGQLVVAFTDRARGSGDGELEPRVALEDYRDNLHRMVETAGQRGIHTVLLTRPFTGTTTDPLWWKNRGPLYNAAAVEVAAETDTPIVDIYTLFRNQDRFFADESHFTLEGHQRAADLIFERIKPFVYPD